MKKSNQGHRSARSKTSSSSKAGSSRSHKSSGRMGSVRSHGLGPNPTREANPKSSRGSGSQSRSSNASAAYGAKSSHDRGSVSSASVASSISGGKAFSYPKAWRAVTGNHALKELLRVRPQAIKLVLLQTNWQSSAECREFMDYFAGKKIQFELKSDLELKKICATHQGVVAFADPAPQFDYLSTGWDDNSLVLALDGVEDPHNLGAIMRTSWLMGVNGIIMPADRAVGLTATVHKVACGGVEHVPIANINNFSDPFEKLKQAGFWVFGMSHKAKKTIYDLKIPEKVIWVMGAEDKGLRIPTERACDELVSIPQIAADASYNVSVATALALSETKRQWQASNQR